MLTIFNEHKEAANEDSRLFFYTKITRTAAASTNIQVWPNTHQIFGTAPQDMHQC